MHISDKVSGDKSRPCTLNTRSKQTLSASKRHSKSRYPAAGVEGGKGRLREPGMKPDVYPHSYNRRELNPSLGARPSNLHRTHLSRRIPWHLGACPQPAPQQMSDVFATCRPWT